jgi:hypothetical protein
MVGRPKGSKNPNAGRKAGIPNKATTEAREAIAMFVESNAERLNGWLDAIAEQSPMAAFDRFMSVVEYHIPKLQRSEVQPLDENGKKANGWTVNVNLVPSNKQQ